MAIYSQDKVIQSINNGTKKHKSFNLQQRVWLCSSDSKQTFILSAEWKSLSKRHCIAQNLQAPFSIETTEQDKSFSGSQTAILLMNLHILLRQAWLQNQKDRKGNKQKQKPSSFTMPLSLNYPKLSISNI